MTFSGEGHWSLSAMAQKSLESSPQQPQCTPLTPRQFSTWAQNCASLPSMLPSSNLCCHLQNARRLRTTAAGTRQAFRFPFSGRRRSPSRCISIRSERHQSREKRPRVDDTRRMAPFLAHQRENARKRSNTVQNCWRLPHPETREWSVEESVEGGQHWG